MKYFIYRSVLVLHVARVLTYPSFTIMNRNLILVWPKLDVPYLWMIHLVVIGVLLKKLIEKTFLNKKKIIYLPTDSLVKFRVYIFVREKSQQQ